ncbi:hypothetical protein KEJ27_04660 [Candidatus Bathyarchaeota archaeon]|nr:hypothetical protein [Candidatus Bathyarchaeota archaeon]
MDIGNMSLLCLVDSSNRRNFEMLHEILWSALNFFGMPYKVFDLAKNSLSLEELKAHSVVVIGQEHLGKSLSEDETKYIIDAVAEGIGLVVFDGDVHHYKDPLKETLGLKTTEEPTHMPHLTTDIIRILDNSHYITAGKELEFIRFNSPVQVGNVVSIEREHKILAILANGSGCPALITETYGRGRVALFTLSPKIWLSKYFGHGGGLDDIFWKSIVWVAKKPFVMLAMPPFVTIRIDDCSGANNFEWVRILNKHGFMPHVSLFTDNISDNGAKIIKDLYDAGLAEFSAHAFTWTKQIYWKPKSPIDHSRGEEYSEDELKRFFEILDSLACKWGIKWSKVLTAHFGEVGKNALSFLIERGITYLAMPYAFGIPYGESPLELREEKMKRLKPFGGQGGVIDRHPDNSEFFIAAPSYWNIPKSMLQLLVDKGVITPQGQIYDFLWETARVKVDIELAAWYAAFGIKLCLDSLSFAVLVTHEQNISVLNSQEWDNLLTRVDKLTSKYEKIYKSWSYIAEYAQNLCNSKLTYVDYNVDTGEIQCQLKGKSSMPLYLHVFKDRYYWIERGFKEVPTYEGEITINFKPENLLFISSAVSK